MLATDLSNHFFIQLIVILFMTRLAGYFGRKAFNQPQAVCEMIMGILLGPSVLGWCAPNCKEWLFPTTISGGGPLTHPSVYILHTFSQMGLIFYMFSIGYMLQKRSLHSIRIKICTVSTASIGGPMLLGALFAIIFFSGHHLFTEETHFWLAAIYCGVCISVTALPTLARILEEKKLINTEVSSLVLSCSFIGDTVSCLCLIAILAYTHRGALSVVYTILGVLSYATVVVKACHVHFGSLYQKAADLDKNIPFVLTVLLVLVGASFSHYLGIHVIFGAFIMGIALPHSVTMKQIVENIKHFNATLFLPVFFVYAGLSASFDSFIEASDWLIALIFILVAFIGKFLFCTLATRFSGMTWFESISAGLLMNCRGLMELVILNIGLETNIITPTFYTMGVLMAIVTTLMTSPLLDYLYTLKKGTTHLETNKEALY